MEMVAPIEVREKKRAALLSVGSALILVSLKSFLVIRTGSLGVLSEALHSGLDLVAKTVVDGFVTALHRSPDFGFSQEFAEYCAYSPREWWLRRKWGIV